MNVLVLEDDLDRQEWFFKLFPYLTLAETAKHAIKYLSEEYYDIIFLDHDLGGEIYVPTSREDTGMGVVRWMQEHRPEFGQCYIHTHNVPAGVEMALKLQASAGEHRVTYLPFRELREVFPKIRRSNQLKALTSIHRGIKKALREIEKSELDVPSIQDILGVVESDLIHAQQACEKVLDNKEMYFGPKEEETEVVAPVGEDLAVDDRGGDS